MKHQVAQGYLVLYLQLEDKILWHITNSFGNFVQLTVNENMSVIMGYGDECFFAVFRYKKHSVLENSV